MSFLEAFLEFGDACTLFPGPIEFAGTGISTTADSSEWIRFAEGLTRAEDMGIVPHQALSQSMQALS